MSSIPVARRELQRLAGEIDDLALRNTRLLVSELVTNAVRHVPAGEGDEITLTIEHDDGHVRVEVQDRGPGFVPSPRSETHDAGSGWGLHILSKLSDRWGVESGDGSLVWFEMPDGMSQNGAEAEAGAGDADGAAV
ncbi:MAG TPA: ATP-binding protein [Solirubrobacteraceae bacterium]|nr:ATP-binding protein [Solirubrobacteraceae bacterium]